MAAISKQLKNDESEQKMTISILKSKLTKPQKHNSCYIKPPEKKKTEKKTPID